MFQTSTFGSHPLVCRFMKGVFETKPSLPRYTETWDVNIMINYLASLGPPKELSLKILTYKVVMLLALLSRQRRQTLHALYMNSMQLTLDKCTFSISTLLKTSRIGHHLKPIEFLAFKPNTALCIAKHVTCYIEQTRPLRLSQTQLLISYQKPYKAVSADTISRWLKTVLNLAGIDTAKYTAHSTRSASTSAAKSMDIAIDIIMESAGWTQESTFVKFSCKLPIMSKNNFGMAVAYCKNAKTLNQIMLRYMLCSIVYMGVTT